MSAKKTESAKKEVAKKQADKEVAKKPAAKKDTVKNIPAKKLPGLYKKSYTAKKYQKKLTGLIYIPDDKKLVESIFVYGANPKKADKYSVPKDALFSKQELKKLKRIAKDVKSHKGRFKAASFIAVLSMLAAIVIVISVFKNPLAKKILKSGCETVFGAKTDIAYVNVSFLSTSITVKNIAIGNRNAEFKNLFEAEKIEADFNLIQALRGKFVAQNLEASGMEFNTDRTTSCALPEKVKKQEEKEAKESVFLTSLEKEKTAAIEKIQYEITNVLGGTDVNSIVANVQSNLKTPGAVEQSVADTKVLVEKWNGKPQEMEKQVTTFAESVKDLQSINVKEIKDAATLKADLEKLNAAIESSKKLKGQVEGVVTDIQKDADSVTAMTKSITASVNSDKEYARSTLLSVAGLGNSAKEILYSGIDSLGYDVLGKFYPFVKTVFNFGLKVKNGDYSSEIEQITETAGTVKGKLDAAKAVTAKNKKTKKTSGKKRMEGITFWYVKDCPSFLIERVKASGSSFDAEIKEITNDPNIRNIPMTAKGMLKLGGATHNMEITMDARKVTSAPLFAVEYKGTGFNADIDGSAIAAKCGVPSLKGATVISLSGTAGTKEFSAGGNVSVKPAALSSDGFENEMLTKYYSQALAAVNSLAFGYKLKYAEEEGLDLKLSGNFGDQFVKALSAAAASVGQDAKKAAFAKIEESLNSSNNEMLASAKQFAGIEGDIKLQNARLEEIQKSMEAKVKEIQDQLTKQATKAASDAMDSTKDQATDAVQNAVNSVLGGFGF